MDFGFFYQVRTSKQSMNRKLEETGERKTL